MNTERLAAHQLRNALQSLLLVGVMAALCTYLPTRLMNAFTAGGGEHAAIALSDGLLKRLDLRELAGVVGHEVSHIAHADIRLPPLPWVERDPLAEFLGRAVAQPRWHRTGIWY
jgi:hypothetical protein